MEPDQGVNLLKWYTSQAGILNASLFVLIGILLYGYKLIFKYFGGQNTDAWARVTQISDARSADAKDNAAASRAHAVALERLSTLVEVSDRRSGTR